MANFPHKLLQAPFIPRASFIPARPANVASPANPASGTSPEWNTREANGTDGGVDEILDEETLSKKNE